MWVRGRAVPDAPVYMFDGHCVLCSRGVRYVLEHDATRTIRFVTIQSAEGRAIARANGVDPDKPRTFVWIHEGKATTFSTAALNLLAFVGGPLRWMGVFRVLPKPVRDFLYARIANNRYRLFGRTRECFLPDPETRKRFVLPGDPVAS
jgi:predicted DCC family thiol-disulfide oxidoreductase YuxK